MMKKKILDIVKAIALPLIIYLIFVIGSRVYNANAAYGTSSHMLMVAQQLVVSILLGLGMGFNMLSGRWDFSYGGMLALAAILSGNIAQSLELGPWGMLMLGLVFGTIFGLISGLIYIIMKVPAIVTSLGMVLIYEMMTNILYNGAGTRVRGDYTMFGRMPYNLVLCVIFVIIFYMIINKTKIGYHIRAIGNGQQIAKNIGVKPRKSAILCYTIGGTFVGVAAVVNTSMAGYQASTLKLESATIMFDAMICVIIGRYIEKYCDATFGIILGALSMRLLMSGLLSVGFTAQTQNIMKGVFLLAFLIISTNQAMVLEKREMKKRAEEANTKYKNMQSIKG